MKILGLRVDGLRKLTAVEMEFTDKGLIQFRGRNRQGKTTILDTFEILLRGTKYIEDDMITHGRKKAEIIGYIDDYEIKRVITQKSNRIEVKPKNGKIIGKPQEFLDSLINELTFNPRPFLNKNSEQKLRFMMDFLKIDFTTIDSKIKENEEERLVVGRLAKNYGELAPVHKAERVNISELIQKMNDIINENDILKEQYQEDREFKIAEIRKFNEYQKKLQSNLDITNGRLKELGEKKAELEQALEEVLVSIKHTKDLLETTERPQPEKSYEVEIEMPLLKDTAELEIEISMAEEKNIQAEAYEAYCNKKKSKASEEAKYKAYTDKINELREQKKEILRNTKTPIEGLEIREDGVYYNGILSENWSEAEGLRISAELCLAMKPKLPAIFIDDGETYDLEGLKALQEWATENDIQAFITIVDSGNGTSAGNVFYIEEGSII